MLFTAFPVLVFAGLDRDIEAHHVLVLPELYSTGQYRVPTTTRPLAHALGAEGTCVSSPESVLGGGLLLSRRRFRQDGAAAACLRSRTLRIQRIGDS
jgi:hypothetical protein